MDIEIIAILVTSLINLLVQLRNSRCTELHSSCCYGLFSVGLERDVIQGDIPSEPPTRCDSSSLD